MDEVKRSFFGARSGIIARQGMITTGHPLASAAGFHVLQQGGNAMDAAVTSAAVLGVVQPMMSGLGGDTFILWFDGASRQVWALNGSGAAPSSATRSFFVSRGYTRMPLRGILSASVPGAVAAMASALERWGSGKFSLAQLLEPAIMYAEEGAPLAPVAGQWVQKAVDLYTQFPSTARIFSPSGRPFGPGDVLVQRDLARSLRLIGQGGREALYRGPLADAIVRHAATRGGLLTHEDLREHNSEITPPIATTYRNLTVYTSPPPSQGVILLIMLSILEEIPGEVLQWGNADGIHLMVEAKKRAFADRLKHLGDPKFVANPLDWLLSKDHAARYREEILQGSPAAVPNGEAGGNTTYFCIADSTGNIVSYITSLSAVFGCGEVIEGTGILLNNRAGRGFTLADGDPNCIAPGKRTMNTLMPFIVTYAREPKYVFGTPGGDGQSQWSLQVLLNMIESHMPPQEAVEAPRWLSFPGTDPETLNQPEELRMEEGFPETVKAQLQTRGHRIAPLGPGQVTGVQVIGFRDGVLWAGCDPRVDGLAIGW